jgi:hypothetical protein
MLFETVTRRYLPMLGDQRQDRVLNKLEIRELCTTALRRSSSTRPLKVKGARYIARKRDTF